MLYRVMGKSPVLEKGVFVAPGAVLVGDVVIREGASIWFNCVLRGDLGGIRVGRGSNIQDGTVIHVDENIPAVIGENCTIGHNATIHACVIGDGTLIGMGAVVLSGARIGENCLIAAGSLVPQGAVIPPESFFAGNPGRVIKSLKPGQLSLLRRGSEVYRTLAGSYKELEPEDL